MTNPQERGLVQRSRRVRSADCQLLLSGNHSLSRPKLGSLPTALSIHDSVQRADCDLPNSARLGRFTSCTAAFVVIEGSAPAGNGEPQYRVPQFRPRGRTACKFDLPFLETKLFEAEDFFEGDGLQAVS